MKNTLTITPDTTVESISNFLYQESERRMDYAKNATYIRNITKSVLPSSAYFTKHLFGFWLKTVGGITTIEKY